MSLDDVKKSKLSSEPRWRNRLAELLRPQNTLPVVGVDPGDSGAVAMLDCTGADLRWWGEWHSLRRKAGKVWRVRFQRWGTDEVMQFDLDTMVEVVELLSSHLREHHVDVYARLPHRLIVEGLFVPPKRKGKGRDVQSLINLFEQAGMCLLAFAGPNLETHRSLAVEWRRTQLGLRRSCPAADAERIALERARQVWANFPEGQAFGHLAEACWIARHGATCIEETVE